MHLIYIFAIDRFAETRHTNGLTQPDNRPKKKEKRKKIRSIIESVNTIRQHIQHVIISKYISHQK